MKIALIGTHGTGKTTSAYGIALKLKENGFNVDILGEVARECPFPINENTTKEAQTWILFMQYLKEIEREEKCDYLVCDRSLLDNYAYYVRKFGRSKALEPFILEHMKSYGYLFKIPINEKYLINDGARAVNKEFQKEMDILIDELLKIFDIPFIDYVDLETTIKTILKDAK
ncbi:MAG: AAA family ATPase [Nanoarchaeota archaeon]